MLQLMYQTIKEINDQAVIIKHKTEITTNEHGIDIQAKDTILNFSEAIPKYLVFFMIISQMDIQTEREHAPNVVSSTIMTWKRQ